MSKTDLISIEPIKAFNQALRRSFNRFSGDFMGTKLVTVCDRFKEASRSAFQAPAPHNQQRDADVDSGPTAD